MTLKSTEHNAYIPPGLTHPPRDDTFDDLKRNESKVYFYSTELPLIQFYTQKLKNVFSINMDNALKVFDTFVLIVIME